MWDIKVKASTPKPLDEVLQRTPLNPDSSSTLSFSVQVEGRSIAPEDDLDLLYMDYFLEDAHVETHTEENLLPLDAHQEDCIKELHLDREIMALLSTQEFPPEDDLSCNAFFSCSWKKHGYQFQDGTINFKSLEEMWFKELRKQAGASDSGVSLAQKLAKDSVDDCRQTRGESDGQTAVMVHNCIYRRLLVLSKKDKSWDSEKLSR